MTLPGYRRMCARFTLAGAKRCLCLAGGGFVTKASQQYRELLYRLLLERELAGGVLPEEDESEYVSQLDQLWWEMTPEEQNQIERELAEDNAPAAPPELGQTDQEVELGQRVPPRRAA
jgi:hypothetical protein